MINTVTGPIPPSELGRVLPHEHLRVGDDSQYSPDVELLSQELRIGAAAGVGTMVELSNVSLKRNVSLWRRVSIASGVRVVASTGFYRDPYLDVEWFDRNPVEHLADTMINDIEEGIDGTGIRAGIIGEIGADRWYISATEERSFRAAARAQRATGVPISTHATRWPVGRAQLDLLEECGVDLTRVVVGHCDSVPDPEFHLSVASRGAFVEFDILFLSSQSVHDTQRTVSYVVNMAKHGFIDKVLISHDICMRESCASQGGCGWGYAFGEFFPLLRKAGIGEEELNMISTENTRRMLTPA